MKNGTNSKIQSFIFLLVVCVLLIFLNGLGKLSVYKNTVSAVINPFLSIFQGYSNSANDFISTIRSIGSFKEENSKLKKENQELAYIISTYKEIERENETLRKQLGFSRELCSKESCYDWKMAKVIGRSPDNYEKYIIIDSGSDEGIRKNQAAVFSGGAMVGKIVDVYDNSSKVLLITSPESSINSITQTTRSNGIVKGKYSTGARLEMINQNEEIIDGDIIITSGLEDGVPKGLLIGKIHGIEESANRIFKEANVSLFVDFTHIEEVFIVEYKNERN